MQTIHATNSSLWDISMFNIKHQSQIQSLTDENFWTIYRASL